ncbi:MFS transporter [Actinoplanes sp. NBC_00393]|uniref:MFS transporter n=1 Tax=Actinoplanes sp. NBC_00393 TaxID=2975953 RepID=UPI002E1B47B3
MVTIEAGALRRARWAVLAAFFANGAAFATWAPRIPAVQEALSLDATMLGLALTGGALGGVLFTLPGGIIVDRLGSRRALLVAIASLSLLLVLPGLAPGWWFLLAAMLVLGAVDSLMDVAMNAHGVLLEQREGRSLLSGFHASWSIGAVLGGLAGAAAAAAGIPVWAHLLAAGALLGTATLLAGRGLLDQRESPHAGAAGSNAASNNAASNSAASNSAACNSAASNSAASNTAASNSAASNDAARSSAASNSAARNSFDNSAADDSAASNIAGREKSTSRIARPTPILVVAGLLVLAAAFIEDVPLSWSAVYFSTGLGASAGVAGLGFVAFSFFMAAGRIVGDRVTDRFGTPRVLLGGGLLIATGFAAGLAINQPLAAIAGFALVGLGASPIFPAAFSVAGRSAGGASGIAFVSMVSRFGFLTAPLLVGILADATDFRYALGVVVLAGAVVAVLSRKLRRELPAGDPSAAGAVPAYDRP